MELVYSKELDFIPKLQLSKSRRAVYYTHSDFVKDKLPKKYLEKNESGHYSHLKKGYIWKEGKVYNTEAKEFIIKNTKSIGKPKYWVINGQDLYNDKFQKLARHGLIMKLHNYVKLIVEDCPKLNKTEDERFELWIYWYINKDYKGPDYDNLWIMEKAINDCLHKDHLNIKAIKEDSHLVMRGGYKGYRYRETEGFKIEIYKV